MQLISHTTTTVPFATFTAHARNGEIELFQHDRQIRVSTIAHWCPETGRVLITNTAIADVRWLPAPESYDWAAFTREDAEAAATVAFEQWRYDVQQAVLRNEDDPNDIIDRYAARFGITPPDPYDTWNYPTDTRREIVLDHVVYAAI